MICMNQVILARAFRGELVEQDPADEPASVLLERIRKNAHATTIETRAGRGAIIAGGTQDE